MPGWSHLEKGGEWPWYTGLLATLGLGKRLAYMQLMYWLDRELKGLHQINKRRLRDELWRNGRHAYLEEQVVRGQEIEDNDWHTLDTVEL